MLNDKQKAFARGILQGLSNREAALQAGYSENSASQQGSRLAKDKRILDYISRLEGVKAKVKEEVDDYVPVGTSEQVQKVFAKGEVKPDALNFLLQVMSDDFEDIKTRVECAKAALPYQYAKKGDVGVKESRENNAQDLASGGGSGRFAAMAPPKTVN